MKSQIYNLLHLAYKPTLLDVIDESYLHQGHFGNSMLKESHFKIIINSYKLNGMKLIDAHKAIYATLADIMPQIHALEIKLLN